MSILLFPRRLAHVPVKTAGFILLFVFALSLAACGGGGGGSASAPPDVVTPMPPVDNPQPATPPAPLPRNFAAAQSSESYSGYAQKAAAIVAPPSQNTGIVSVAAAGITATGTHTQYRINPNNDISYAHYVSLTYTINARAERCWLAGGHLGACRASAGNAIGNPRAIITTLSIGVMENSVVISAIRAAVPGVSINAFAVATARGQSANISSNAHQATTGLHNVNLPLARGVHVVHSHYDCVHSTTDCYRWLSGSGRVGDEATGQAAELNFVNHVARNDVAYIWAALPVTISSRAAGFWASAPRAFPELRGKWVVAAAANVAEVNTNEGARLFAALRNRRASCYGIEEWCLVAHAETPHEAAAKTTGALALMKKRSYDAPMSVLVNILLDTADKVRAGARDTSPTLQLLGSGVLNTNAALAAVDDMRTANGLALANARFDIPPVFRGLAKSLRDESIAVRYSGGRYYNHPLDSLVRAQSAPQMQVNAGDVWEEREVKHGENFFAVRGGGKALRAAGVRLGALEIRRSFGGAGSRLSGGGVVAPFFAANDGRNVQMRLRFGGGFSGFAANGDGGDGYRQVGVLFERGFGRVGFQSSFSRINENGALLGGKWGAVAKLRRGGESMQARAKMTFAAGDDVQLFAAAEQLQTRAATGGIISRINGLRAFGWHTGAAAKDVFRYGDRLRFGLTGETTISDGVAILRMTQTTPDGLRTIERPTPLASAKHRTISAVYGFTTNENARWSFAAARRIGEETRAHLEWRMKF